MSTLSRRNGQIQLQVGSMLGVASGYKVTALPVGAQVVSATTSAITVRAGHGFAAGDKFIKSDGTRFTGTQTVSSVAATTLNMSGTGWAGLAAGDVLLNLGPDTGIAAPNYDESPIAIYSDMDGTTLIADATVTTAADGQYGWWSKATGAWEVVRNSAGAVVDYLVGASGGSEINVCDFGAAGDGSADDTYRVQAAIDAGLELGINVYLPTGRYRTTATLNIVATYPIYPFAVEHLGFIFQGQSMNGRNDETAGSVIVYEGSDICISITGFRVVLRNLRVTNKTSTTAVCGIKFYNSGECGLEYVCINDDLYSHPNPGQFNYNLILDSVFQFNGREVLSWFSLSGYGVYIASTGSLNSGWINFNGGSFYANKYAFGLNGNLVGFSLIGSFCEGFQEAFHIDSDSEPVLRNLNVERCVFNCFPAVGYGNGPHEHYLQPRLMKVSHSDPTRAVQVVNFNFQNNIVNVGPDGSGDVDYHFELPFTDGPDAAEDIFVGRFVNNNHLTTSVTPFYADGTTGGLDKVRLYVEDFYPVVATLLTGTAYIVHMDHTGSMYNIRTGNAVRVSVLEDGSVGIGTIAPTQLLTVSKIQNAETYVQVQNSNTAGTSAAAGFIASSSSGNYLIMRSYGNSVPTYGGHTSIRAGATSRLYLGTCNSLQHYLDNTTVGTMVHPAGTTVGASLRVPHGAAPTSPVNGDMWTTTAGLFIQINGSTVGPLG